MPSYLDSYAKYLEYILHGRLLIDFSLSVDVSLGLSQLKQKDHEYVFPVSMMNFFPYCQSLLFTVLKQTSIHP